MSKRYVVVGSSAAGIGVLGKLRSLDAESEIICVSKQRELPYNTCLLADFLADRKNQSSIFTKGLDFFEKNNIKLLLDSEVTKIDKELQEIEVNNYQKISYDKLFLGLGTLLNIPKIVGLNYLGVFGFHTLADTSSIVDFIDKNNVKIATIIGAGLSGIECSDSLTARDVSVNLIEKQSHLLPLVVDSKGSAIIEKLMPNFDVNFFPNTTVEQIIGSNNKVEEVVLSSGEILKTDMVIFATGSTPNVKIAMDVGIATKEGIIVNEFMQTSDSNIYAGGDVALFKSLIDGKLVRNSSWPDAMQQGIHAAFSMAGQSKPYVGVCLIASSHFYNTTFVSCGNVVNPKDNTEICIKSGENFYHKFILEDGKLIGFLMVGNVKNLGELRRLVVSKEIVDKKYF